MIEVQNLAKSFGNRTLWSSLSFEVSAGEMLGLVGPSGSGKSTLLNCIGLLEAPDDGRIFVGGQEVTSFGGGARRRFRRDSLGYLFQNYALIDNASIDDNLDVAMGVNRFTNRRLRNAYEEALKAVGLEGRGKDVIYRLSGGEQQRVALARILVRKPKVILADEPTGALDEINASMVIDVLRDLCKRGCVVVVATHNSMVESYCDVVLNVADQKLVHRVAG